MVSTSPAQGAAILSLADRIFFWGLAIVPSLAYPSVCWAYWKVINYKKNRILEIIGSDARRRLYVRSFAPAPHTEDNPFSSLFDITYNVQAYIIAVIINMIIAIIAAFVSLERLGFSLGLPSAFEAGILSMPVAVLTGMAGAYVFGIFEILQEYRSGDLSAIALHFTWLRLLVVAILSAVSGQVLKDQFSTIVAFGMGVFPLFALFEWVRGVAEKQLGASVGAIPAEPATLYHLEGMTRGAIDRLEDEGIDSTQSLAFADPIRLLLRTNFEWKIILDFIDQSFLYNYVGEKISDLRPLGIRGAIEIMDAWDSLGGEEGTQAILDTPTNGPQTILHEIAARLGQPLFVTRYLMMTVTADLHMEFIRDLWSRAGDQTNSEGEASS